MPIDADRLIQRLKNKYPMLQNFTDRSFGVEIEFFGLDYLIIIIQIQIRP